MAGQPRPWPRPAVTVQQCERCKVLVTDWPLDGAVCRDRAACDLRLLRWAWLVGLGPKPEEVMPSDA